MCYGSPASSNHSSEAQPTSPAASAVTSFRDCYQTQQAYYLNARHNSKATTTIKIIIPHDNKVTGNDKKTQNQESPTNNGTHCHFNLLTEYG
jgi:hypothetical protein